MSAGSKTAEFLAKGAYAVLRPGALLSASKVAALAAVVGSVISAQPVSAQQAMPYISAPRTISPVQGTAPYQRMVPPTAAYGAVPLQQPAYPASGRMRDPGTSGVYRFGNETIDARHVHATVAAAMTVGTGGRPGVDPAALLALQSRSADALSRMQGGDTSNQPIDGPYAFSTQRWLAAFARFMPSLGRADLARQIDRAPNGQLDVRTRDAHEEIMGMRSDPYVASVVAAAEMVANDARYRSVFGIGPNLAELATGHHAGPETMIRISQAVRAQPGAPLAAIIGEARARDLIVLTGLEGVVSPQAPAAHYLGSLNNAFRNGLARYQAVRTVMLPPDYRPAAPEGPQAGPYQPR